MGHGARAKDARLATQAAAAKGPSLRLGPVIHDVYQAAADAGFRDEDIAYVSRLYR